MYTFLSCSFFCLKDSRSTMSHWGAKYSVPFFYEFHYFINPYHAQHSSISCSFYPQVFRSKVNRYANPTPPKNPTFCVTLMSQLGPRGPALDKPDRGAEVSNEFPNEGEALKTQQFPWQEQQQDPKASNNTFHALSWVVGTQQGQECHELAGL